MENASEIKPKTLGMNDSEVWNFFVIYIVRYIFPIPVVISSVVNILCLVTIARHRESFPKTTRLHMLCIIINDILLLTVKCPLFYFNLNRTVREESAWDVFKDPSLFGIHMCRTYTFFTYYCQPGMAFFQLGLTIDRLIAVVWPFQSRSILTGRFTKILIFCLFLVSLSFPALFINTIEIYHLNKETNKTSLLCDTSVEHQHLFEFYSAYEFFMLMLLILALSTGSAVILVKICESVREMTGISNEENATRRRSCTRRLSVMLLLMNFAFFISYLPFAVFQFIFNAELIDDPSTDSLVVFGILNTVSYFPSFVHWMTYFIGETFRHCFFNTTYLDRLLPCLRDSKHSEHHHHQHGQRAYVNDVRKMSSPWCNPETVDTCL